MSARSTVMRLDPPTPLSRAVKGVVLTFCCLLIAVPFVGVIATSLADQEDVTRGGGFVLIPHHVSLAAYQAILSGGVVTQATMVSLLITSVGTTLSLTCSTLLAFALSRTGSYGHKPLLMVVLFAILFTPGIIPSYLVVKGLGLLNSYWSVILPVVINAFNVVVLRAFFQGLPDEIMESARLDGANDFQILTRIVLPLSKAVLAVIGLFYAVSYWNAFFGALLYLNDSGKWPLQLILRTYVVNQQTLGTDQITGAGGALPPQQAIEMAILVISIVPIMLVYPFVQRHFTKGVLVGAIKG
jgi:multiple sugar transport system permease protein/putative aldouronate transport system permease protein